MFAPRNLVRTARFLPAPLKSIARRLYYRSGHWAHGDLKRFGTVQDQYYWVSDGNLDTLLLLQNYFSVLYPNLDTATDGNVSIFDEDGGLLGTERFDLGHNCCARMNVASLLERLRVSAGPGFGTLEVNINIPGPVLESLQGGSPFYFWDRFYIGYTNARGQTCFVHGVDKTHIYQDGSRASSDWYRKAEGRQWAPETPVNIEDYKQLTVVMQNRSGKNANVTLTLSDSGDQSLSWEQHIPAKGVRRFYLTKENTAGLIPAEMRMLVSGMSSTYGRPVVFKEFANGAFSAMHC